MNKLIFGFLFSVLFISSSSILIEKINPEGKWKMISAGNKVSYVDFLPDGKMRFVDSKSDIIPNDVALRYKFDFKKDPATCDIIIYSFSGDKVGLIEGIIKIKDKNNFTLKSSKERRPKSFDEKFGDEAEFTRIK
jgi:predicted secreted protein